MRADVELKQKLLTVDLGYQAHVLVGTIAKYMRYITGVKG